MNEPGVDLDLSDRLATDERVLWWSSPRPDRYAERGWPMPRAFFGAGCVVFGLGNLVSAGVQLIRQGALPGPPVFLWTVGMICLGHLVVGVVLLSSPLWMRIQGTGIIYVVTTHRAIVVNRSPVRLPWQAVEKDVSAVVLGEDSTDVGDVGGDDFFFGLSDDDELAARVAVEQLVASWGRKRAGEEAEKP